MSCDRAVLVLGLVLSLASCGGREPDADRADAVTLTGGDPDRGALAIGRYGCGSCHEIPGVRSARGTVGPSLSGIAGRTYIAGQLSNSPANLMRWVQHPRHVEPRTAMPEMGVTEVDARDITAYLYTLR
jgi:cytochrome c